VRREVNNNISRKKRRLDTEGKRKEEVTRENEGGRVEREAL
jgi:hypothetical protein